MFSFFSKKLFFGLILAFFLLITFKSLAFFSEEAKSLGFESAEKNIFISDNGLMFEITTKANTVSETLAEKNIKLDDHDIILPDINSPLFPGINIEIKRAVKIKIQADGKTISGYTLSNNIRDALTENGVTLGRLDKTTPESTALPQNNLAIIVTRISVEEITQDEDIDFKTITKLDPKMGWREKNITTPGEKGVKEVKYRVTYKDNKEISRVVLSKSVVTDPVTQIETQGTYVKCGSPAKGQGTWYSNQGGLFAASLAIPRGGYAKVTNTANGKSVIVQINDSGPYGKGRIIDLDKVAFQKIGNIGAGVIGVKVEEVLN